MCGFLFVEKTQRIKKHYHFADVSKMIVHTLVRILTGFFYFINGILCEWRTEDND